MTDASTTNIAIHDPLIDLDTWAAEGAPHEWFRARRQESSLWQHPARPDHTDSPAVWSVLGYDEVVALGRCPHAMSSDQEHGGVTGLGPGDELDDQFTETLAQAGGAGVDGSMAKHLLTLDPPEHTSYRKIVNKGFTPRQIRLLEDQVHGLLDELLDRQPTGEPFDFATQVSMPLPINVIARMIGSEPEHDHDLMRWSNEAITSTDPEYAGQVGSQLGAVMALIQHFNRLRDEHRTEPRDDLITTLMEAEVDGETLSDGRFMLFLVLLTAAGNETTRTAFSHAIVELARHPDEWRRLKDDPCLIPSAVEEVVRYSSPVLYFRRNAIEPMEIAGHHIAAGDTVALWYASANRDEAIFDDPDRFDIGRDPNPHIGFGGGGPHFCLGASLARLEIQVLIEAMVERYDSIELAGPVDRVRSNFLHGIKHLPVILR